LIHDEVILDDFGEVTEYKITPYQVASWITPGLMPEVSKRLGEAMSEDMPDLKDIPGAIEQLEAAGITLDDNGVPIEMNPDAKTDTAELKNG
jgi:hypothetical protein